MRVVYTPKHQLHDPGFEVTAGQRVPAYEVPSRATSILDALRGAEGRPPAFAAPGATSGGGG